MCHGNENDAKFKEELTCRLSRVLECLMALKIEAKFEGKLTCASKNDMRNLANFHRLKNSDFILESKVAEPNKNKNLKQLHHPDAGRKLILPWK